MNEAGRCLTRNENTMSSEEYRQLKAFARVDGVLLAVMWTASFACCIGGLASPMLSLIGMLIGIFSPFFAAMRLIKFRDNVRDGIISFRRGYAYTVLMFFYAAILFALAQLIYFQFIDQGYIMSRMTMLMSDDVNRKAMDAYGMTETFRQAIAQMSQTRPIDYALSYLSINIFLGFILGLPIAAVTNRKVRA